MHTTNIGYELFYCEKENDFHVLFVGQVWFQFQHSSTVYKSQYDLLQG